MRHMPRGPLAGDRGPVGGAGRVYRALAGRGDDVRIIRGVRDATGDYGQGSQMTAASSAGAIAEKASTATASMTACRPSGKAEYSTGCVTPIVVARRRIVTADHPSDSANSRAAPVIRARRFSRCGAGRGDRPPI